MTRPKPPPSPEPVVSTGVIDCDRMLGGGLRASTCYLIGGEPGAGKSSLLRQWISYSGGVYISTEEGATAVRDATRKVAPAKVAKKVRIIAEREIEKAIKLAGDATVLVVDSISGLGTSREKQLSNLKLCIEYCRALSRPVIAVSHLNKDGGLAGLKSIEHAVDGVLMLTGDRDSTSKRLTPLKLRGVAPQTVSLTRTDHGFEEGYAEALKLDRHEPVIGSILAPVSTTNAGIALCEICVVACPGRGRVKARGIDAELVKSVVTTISARWSHLAKPLSRLDLVAETDVATNDSQITLALAMAVMSAVTKRPLPAITLTWGSLLLHGGVRTDDRWDERADLARRLPEGSTVVNPFEATTVDAAWLELFPREVPEIPDQEPGK